MNPWEAVRIKEENEILKKYGLKNKTELWRAQTMLRSFREQSKDLQARLRYNDVQAQKETGLLLNKLKNLSVLPENATLDDVLALNVEAILGRRLQTLVYLKGLAATPSHARQLIIHGHACVSGRKVTVPGYLVRTGEENTVVYNPKSPLANDLHPARPKKDEIGVPAPTAPVPAPAVPPSVAPQQEQSTNAQVEGVSSPTEPAPESAAKTEKGEGKKVKSTNDKQKEGTQEK